MSNLALTDDIFFTRGGLDKGEVQRLVGESLAGADDGELFLEYSQSEALSWDDGRLKSATFDTSQGFGLRAVSGETFGYAHAAELSEAAIGRAGETVRAVSAGHGGTLALPPRGTNQRLYVPENPLEGQRLEAKLKLLADIDTYARGRDPRVRQVTASLTANWQAVQIMRAEGDTVADIRPLVRLNVSVIVGEGDRQETGSYGTGGRTAYDLFFDESRWKHAADEAIRQACVNLGSIPAPAGEMTVVLGAGWPGILLHEAVGHGLEGDFNRKGTSAFAGLMGQRVAAPGVTIVDDGTIENRRGSLTIDDEGHPSQCNILIEDGILVGYMQDRMNARVDGPAAYGQRPARRLRQPCHAAHDEHLHAGRRPRSGRDHRFGGKGFVRRQLWRRAGGHHVRQVRVFRDGSLHDRERAHRRACEGRHPDRERPRRSHQNLDDRQRHAPG